MCVASICTLYNGTIVLVARIKTQERFSDCDIKGSSLYVMYCTGHLETKVEERKKIEKGRWIVVKSPH